MYFKSEIYGVLLCRSRVDILPAVPGPVPPAPGMAGGGVVPPGPGGPAGGGVAPPGPAGPAGAGPAGVVQPGGGQAAAPPVAGGGVCFSGFL